MKILVLNAGSSSLKYQLFAMPNEVPLCTGQADRIGLDSPTLTHKVNPSTGEPLQWKQELPLPDHSAALQAITRLLTDREKGVLQRMEEIEVIGHRVVHGGEAFASTMHITEEVKDKIRSLFDLAPLHNPANLQGIEVAEKLVPHARQVAVFDTAFHQSMPAQAYRFALPENYYTEMGIRAYGFHGTSHQYVSQLAAAYLNRPKTRVVVLHLGNGCSATAVVNGRSVDTSMGLGPMGGLVMGTRSGDLDPAVIFYLINDRGMDARTVNNVLNKESGLLGLCGYSDMRDVKTAMAQGDQRALLAYEIYAYRIRKYIGALAAAMGGLDAVVFTAGVGENDPDMRALSCHKLQFMGVLVDDARNRSAAKGLRDISPPDSPVKVLVIPTNEELEIARTIVDSQ